MRFIGALLVVAALLSGCGRPDPTPLSAASRGGTEAPRFGDSDPHPWDGVAPWRYPVHGIDVSKWQGTIDWPAVRRGGVAFAYIKATEGGDVADDRFRENWFGARAAGVLRGAYHYYYFCRTAEEQARWFIQHVPQDAAALPHVLDMEWTHTSRTCRHRPDPSHVRAEMAVFVAILERHYGRRPLIYTTVDFYADNELWKVRGEQFWLRSVAGHPGTRYPGQAWTLWQYTGTGVVPGIRGDTDINVFGGSQAQWAGWARGRG